MKEFTEIQLLALQKGQMADTYDELNTVSPAVFKRKRSSDSANHSGVKNKAHYGRESLFTLQPPITQNSDLIDNLTAIKIGTDQGQRLGRQIHVHSVSIRICMAALGNKPNKFKQWLWRVILLVDTQNNKEATLDIEKFLQPIPGIGQSDQEDVMRFRNFDYTQRYLVLYDRTMRNNATGGVQNPVEYINFTKNVDFNVDFSGDTVSQDPTNLTTNCFKLLILAESFSVGGAEDYGTGGYLVHWKIGYSG